LTLFEFKEEEFQLTSTTGTNLIGKSEFFIELA